MAEELYMVEFKLPQFDWTHWAVCASIADAEQALIRRRRELTDPSDKYVQFRIVRHEVIESDVAGPIDIERCAQGHSFTKLPSHPKNQGVAECPYCLSVASIALKDALEAQTHQVQLLSSLLNSTQEKLSRLASIVLKFLHTADKTMSSEAFAEYEKYREDTKQ
jgi:hypothetical protein